MKTICTNQSLDCLMSTAQLWAQANPLAFYFAMVMTLMAVCYWSVR
jgi:hypothetical protein